jgi:phosphatidylinositol 3-kinase
MKRIIAYPSTKQLVLKEKRLVWRFRYYLRTNSAKVRISSNAHDHDPSATLIPASLRSHTNTSFHQALTKFARCVDWNNRKDVQMATELMHQWDEIEVADALELLSASFRGIDPVRRYAISCLGKANDEALMMYLLQLVQALRYDKGFLSDEEIEALKVTSAISEGGGGGGGGGGERKVSTLMRTIRRRKGKIKVRPFGNPEKS